MIFFLFNFLNHNSFSTTLSELRQVPVDVVTPMRKKTVTTLTRRYAVTAAVLNETFCALNRVVARVKAENPLSFILPRLYKTKLHFSEKIRDITFMKINLKINETKIIEKYNYVHDVVICIFNIVGE